MGDLRISLLQRLVESAPNAIVVVDDAGRIVLANSQAERLFGYSQRELLDQPVEILLPERLRAKHVEHLAAYFARPCSQPMETNPERCARRKDGSEFPVDISLSPLETDEGLLVTAILRDSTERKQAEEQAKRLAEQRISLQAAALGAAANAIVITDRDGTIQWVNPAFTRLTGYTVEEAIGQNPRLLKSGKQDPRVYEQLWHTVLSGQVWHRELINRRKDGTLYSEEMTITPVRGPDGEIANFIAIKQDISARKRAEEEIGALNADLARRVAELAAVNRELEAFSYSVSHDLRAPLRSIDGFSQALLEDYADKLDATGTDYLRRVRVASQRMAQLIDDLLQLSRLTRAEMHLELVDLSALARTIAAELQETQPDRQVDFIIAEGLAVRGDGRLLRIALENLLHNAWKFTGKRAPARIEFGMAEYDGKPAYFVRDNGAGFDMAYVHRLFGAFQRLHSWAEFEGTGIGLATIQRIIHRHGGRVWAEAEVDRGATFYFTV